MFVLLIWFRQEIKKDKIGMITLRGVWLTTEIMTRMFPTFGTITTWLEWKCINILIGIFPTFGTTILWLDEAMRTIEQWEPMKSNDQGVFQWGLSVFGSHQRHDDHRPQSQYRDNRLPKGRGQRKKNVFFRALPE